MHADVLSGEGEPFGRCMQGFCAPCGFPGYWQSYQGEQAAHQTKQ